MSNIQYNFSVFYRWKKMVQTIKRALDIPFCFNLAFGVNLDWCPEI